MKKILLIFVSFLSAISLSASSIQDSLSAMFLQGNQYYQEKEYVLAVESYLEVAAQGYVSEQLYYNLGNAYFKAGEIGKSILYYEKALLLNPSNDDIKHNLAFANQQITDRIEALPELFIVQWWNSCSAFFSYNGWAVVGVVSAFLVVIFILVFLFSRAPLIKNVTLLLFVLSVIFLIFSTIFGYKQLNQMQESTSAIVMAPIVNAKSTPSKSGSDLFVIHEGLKVSITDQLNEWVEVKIPNGEKGWVLIESIQKI